MSSPAATLRGVRHTRPTQPETVTASLAADSGLVFLESLDVPTEVQPGENIPIAVDVRNDAQLINPLDPDYCIPPNLFNGFRLEIVARIDGIEQDRIRRCIAQRQVRTVNLQVRAPTDEGPINLTLEVVGGNTGHFQDDVGATVDVRADAQAQPCPQGFVRDPETGECVLEGDGGGDGGGDDDTVQQATTILTLLTILAGIALLSGISR